MIKILEKYGTLIVVTIFSLVIFVLQYQINDLYKRLEIAQQNNNQSYANMQLMSEIYINDAQALQERIESLDSANASQEAELAKYAETLDCYNHHVDDLQKELNAYEIALEEAAPMFQLPTTWDGPILTKEKGGNMGPAGRETYYNLNMNGCIATMRRLGYSEEEYPYWVREDGAKMLGRYVMIAANWKIRPLGTIIETSLGWSIVVDTGDFVAEYPYGVDIAVDW